MKILYGIQGTGNGHLSRAMAMAESLRQHPGLDITWLLSGRPDDRLHYGPIAAPLWRRGLTLDTRNGRVNPLRTLLKNNIPHFLRDVRSLDLSPFDLVVSDFEPLTAHAARRQKRSVIGLSRQAAFDYDIPVRGATAGSRLVMRHFAPSTTSFGLHWHHFDQPLLPPILHLDREAPRDAEPRRVVVYLPMENLDHIIGLLKRFKDHDFRVYHPACRTEERIGAVHLHPLSITGFREDLYRAERVICNSGFELISECLFLGKAVLTRPLAGQMEQLSNALALEQLGYACVVDRLEEGRLAHWLEQPQRSVQLPFPDVAQSLAGWIAGGCQETLPELSRRLWRAFDENRRSMPERPPESAPVAPGASPEHACHVAAHSRPGNRRPSLPPEQPATRV